MTKKKYIYINQLKINKMETKNENKKAIAWVRCSTDKQHTADEQFKAIIELAAKDGYTADNLIKIGREGASAIKVDAAYKEDLNRMYDLMNSGVISTVYAWAVDRIGRDTKENTFFKYKLLDCGVSFKTVEGVNMEAGEDGIATILLDLKQRISEDEMRKKAARFKIGKDRNRELGRWNGGKVCYGYKVNDKGYFEIDEETANVVRRIFNLYINTNESTTTIARTLYNEGLTDRKTEKGRTNFVLHILKNRNYLGVHPFERIITDEDFNKAQVKMTNSKKQPRHTQNTCMNYAHGLLRVKNDAAKNKYFLMTIRRNDGQYVECNSMYCVDADTVDSLLMYAANKYAANYSQKDAEEKAIEIAEKVKDLEAQSLVLAKRVNTIDSKLERVEKSYIEGGISEEKRNMMRNQYKGEKTATLNEIDSIMQMMQTLGDRCTAILDGEIDNLYTLTDRQRKDEINKIVKYCEVERVANGTYNIMIHYKFNDNVETYQIKSKAHKYFELMDGELVQFQMDKLNRYTEKRKRAKVELKKAA